MPRDSRPTLPAGEWTDAKRESVDFLWQKGVTLYEIARILQLNPNQVVGFVHRGVAKKRLEPRASPIVRDGKPRPPRLGHRPTLAALPSVAPAAQERPQRPLPPLPVLPVVVAMRASLPPRVEAPKPIQIYEAPKPYGRVTTCKFIAGEGKPWLECGAEAVPGRPYCAEHCARCFSIRPERSDVRSF